MQKEEEFIKIIKNTLNKNSHIGDDCAYLKDLNIVISSDALIENVHFSLKYMSAYEVGKKAMLVNISDILASGAKPLYATVSLSGKLNEKFVEDFYKGANKICTDYDIEIAGGDLTSGDCICVSISIIGHTKGKNISSRKNAKCGYKVFLAGYHGASAKGLIDLNNGILNSPFIKHHKEPVLYPKISEYVSLNTKKPYAMMDTSDGLFDALKKISASSNVGFAINYDDILKYPDNPDLVFYGGEDYGLLICMDGKDASNFDFSEAPYIGQVTDDKKILINGIEIKEDKSFEHFKN